MYHSQINSTEIERSTGSDPHAFFYQLGDLKSDLYISPNLPLM